MDNTVLVGIEELASIREAVLTAKDELDAAQHHGAWSITTDVEEQLKTALTVIARYLPERVDVEPERLWYDDADEDAELDSRDGEAAYLEDFDNNEET